MNTGPFNNFFESSALGTWSPTSCTPSPPPIETSALSLNQNFNLSDIKSPILYSDFIKSEHLYDMPTTPTNSKPYYNPLTPPYISPDDETKNTIALIDATTSSPCKLFADALDNKDDDVDDDDAAVGDDDGDDTYKDIKKKNSTKCEKNQRSQCIFGKKTTNTQIELVFESIEENSFNALMEDFAWDIVYDSQQLGRNEISALLDSKDNFIWLIDRYVKSRQWCIKKSLCKQNMYAEQQLEYIYTVESRIDNDQIKNIFHNNDILPLSKVIFTKFNMDLFSIDPLIHRHFQTCDISTIKWMKSFKIAKYNNSRNNSNNNGADDERICTAILQKTIHKNGRYDYNFTFKWDVGATWPCKIPCEVKAFQAYLQGHHRQKIDFFLHDINRRQIWCDSMLTLKPIRPFKLFNNKYLERNYMDDGSNMTIAFNTTLKPTYMANKLDGERCFGFLSSSGLLVISSTTLSFIKDAGLKNLKQVYYVLVERLPGDLYFLIDVVYVLRYTHNLNPNFSSNNKMFENNLRALPVNILDSIQFINALPTQTILKNQFVTDSNNIPGKCALFNIPPENPHMDYDGHLAITKNAIYKIKEHHTIELEVCLRSLLLEKLNYNKQQPMHKFLKQWKKNKMIVGKNLFNTFSKHDLQDIFTQVYMYNKVKFNLVPIDWGDKYSNNPTDFIYDHFSTHRQQQQHQQQRQQTFTSDIMTVTAATTTSSYSASSLAATDTSKNYLLEILNTRIIVEFMCICVDKNRHHNITTADVDADAATDNTDAVEIADTAGKNNQIILKYLRKRYDKLNADTLPKVKTILNHWRTTTTGDIAATAASTTTTTASTASGSRSLFRDSR